MIRACAFVILLSILTPCAERAPPATQPATQPLAAADGPQAQFTDALLDHLVGEWSSAIRFPNRTAEHIVKAEWILNHQFLQIRMTDTAQPPQYQAIVSIGFDHAANRYVLHWLDIFGGKFSESLGYATRAGEAPGAGKVATDTIQFVFNYPDGEFHNTFAWHAESKTWTMTLEQKDEHGQWSLFAEETLRATDAETQRPRP